MNYCDVTLLIPVRIDTKERMCNLEGVLQYYQSFGVKLILGEEDEKPKCDYLKYRFPYIDYKFFKSTEPYFYRTRILNELTKLATTKYVANYDCDVFFPQIQIDKSIQYLNEGYDVVYPFDGRFFNVLRPDLKLILNHQFDERCRGWITTSTSIGGCIFFNRSSYIKGGGENENFISWGYEDNERFHRFNMLGFKVIRVEGQCYHINHPRGINSRDANPYIKKSEAEYKSVIGMTKEQLEEHVKNSKFIKI